MKIVYIRTFRIKEIQTSRKNRNRGEDASKTAQLILEYDPHPPFDAGSPKKAPTALVKQLKSLMGDKFHI
ncbi:hypothetical protein [Risungbinella massiliensis]|uniref:hypothetical protein n=1 Tax=Risungbinella massiliensis TaxID=1329796 RepID=UPI0005CBFADE|nr:hypothetical protein [Risungbinella massiliensis]